MYQSGMVLARPGCSPSRTQTCGMPQGTSLHLHQSDKCMDSMVGDIRSRVVVLYSKLPPTHRCLFSVFLG